MTMGFVRPLQGRDPLSVPIRGLSPTAIHIHPRRGWEMQLKCLIQRSGAGVRAISCADCSYGLDGDQSELFLDPSENRTFVESGPNFD